MGVISRRNATVIYVREQIDSFLNYLAVERGLSSNTLDAYFNDLSGLIEYLEDGGKARTWRDVDALDISGFVDDLDERGYARTFEVDMVNRFLQRGSSGPGQGFDVLKDYAIRVDRVTVWRSALRPSLWCFRV